MTDLEIPLGDMPFPPIPHEADLDLGLPSPHLSSGQCPGPDLKEEGALVESDDDAMKMPTCFMGIDVDPVAGLIPGPSRKEFQALRDDIARNGLVHPPVKLHGKWIDGRLRLMACMDLGITPASIDLSEDTDPLSYIMSVNAHRRHLTKSQYAIVVVAAREWAGLGYNQHSGGCEPGASPATSQGMANMAGVSKRLIQQAKIVHKAGLDQDVLSGRMSLKDAVALAMQKDRSQVDAGKDPVCSDSIVTTVRLPNSEPPDPLITLEDPELVHAATGGGKRISGTRKHASHEKQDVASSVQGLVDEHDAEIQRLRAVIQEREDKIHELTDELEHEQEITKDLRIECDQLKREVARLKGKANLPVRESNETWPDKGYAPFTGSACGIHPTESIEEAAINNFRSEGTVVEVACD